MYLTTSEYRIEDSYIPPILVGYIVINTLAWLWPGVDNNMLLVVGFNYNIAVRKFLHWHITIVLFDTKVGIRTIYAVMPS